MRSTVNLKQREVLLEHARQMFLKHGIKSLTMDMIAKSLSMSKKTIYLMVRDKSQLVKEVIERYVSSEYEVHEVIKRNSENPLHELVLMINHVLKQTDGFNPETLFDMQQLYPESYTLFNKHRTTFLYNRLVENMEAGVEAGLYRSDFNKDVIAKIYIGMLKVFVDQQLFPSKKYPFVLVLKEYLDYHLRAIVTEKGLQELQLQKQKFKESKI